MKNFYLPANHQKSFIAAAVMLLLPLFVFTPAVNAKGGGHVKKHDPKKESVLNPPKALISGGPALSYSTPHTYYVGTAISPLSPTASGVYAASYNNTPSAFGTGFQLAWFTALDANGDIYVTDPVNGTVDEIPAGGGAMVAVGSGFNTPNGVAVDAAGNIYVSDSGNGVIKKISAADGSITTISPAGKSIYGEAIATDAAGNVYIVDARNHAVEEISNSGNFTVLSTAFTSPLGIAVDGAGNIYVTDYGTNEVTKMPPGGGTPVVIGSGYSYLFGVAVDNAGNVYVTDDTSGTITRIPASGGSAITLSQAFTEPTGMAIDGNGNLYVCHYNDANGNGMSKVTPTGGYFITPALPAGLSFNSNTGVISGTPSAATPMTSYTVNAYNPNGGASFQLSIQTVLPPPPVISYATPQTYIAGTAITPLSPAATGVAAPGYGPTALLGGSFNEVTQVSVDGAGDVFTADYGNADITEFRANEAPVLLVTGVNVSGVTTDAAGNIYYTDLNAQAVDKIAAGTNTATTFATGFGRPWNLATDAAGNVYVTDINNSAVYEISPVTGATVTLASNIPSPAAIALDNQGNVYINNYNGVYKIPAGGGTPVQLNTVNFTSFAMDNAGNIYEVSDSGGLNIIPAGSNTPVSTGPATSMQKPESIAIDPAGDLFVFTATSGQVSKLVPQGGYFISPELSPGLSFNATTGVISGTPALASPATAYQIAAYNSWGAAANSLSIQVRATAPAKLSYAGPKSFIPGTPITTLSPVSSGVAAAGYSTAPITIASGFSAPWGVTLDAAGDIFVSDDLADVVKEIPAGTSSIFTIASGFKTPLGVAVDAAGNVYVADYGNNAVKKIAPGGSPVTAIGSGLSTPGGVAVDQNGNVFVTDYTNGLVKKIPAGNGTPVVIGTGFNEPYGVAVDSAGNVYVADYGNNAVKKIPAGGGAIVAIGSGFIAPTSVAVDASGNIFIADSGNSDLKEIQASGGNVVTLLSSAPDDYGIAAGTSGILYVTDQTNNLLTQINPTGGYYLNMPLPAGLSLSGSTGAISGTPTVLHAATNYTVTAWNAGGPTAANINIAVVQGPADLANLTISSGTLSPAFAEGITSYTDNVTTTSVTVTPTTVNAGATITVNGVSIASGFASQTINLSPGSNTIAVVVTSPQGGGTTKKYTITVNRPTANLSALAISAGSLTPTFNATTTSYNVSVNNTVTSVTLTPTAAASTSTITVNGTAVTSGTASAAINLNVGANAIPVVVTASDGVTKQTYTVTVTRAAASNDNLASLKISQGTLTPAFAVATTSYTASVANTVMSMTVTPTTSDPNATVQVNGTAVTSGTASGAISLSVGSNTINVLVTAANGMTQKTYSIVVTRAASSNDNLSALAASVGSITPTFNASTTSYADAVNNVTTSITITPTTSDPTATVTVNGTAVTSGSASGAISLNVGANAIPVVVTAADGVTTKTYTLTVTRAAASNDNLTKLTLSSGTLNPAFAAATLSYTASVANTVASITVTPTTADPGATVEVNGTAVTSGTASGAITLAVGSNTINVLVTAANGVTNKTYSIVVTRASGGADVVDPISVTQPAETPVLADDGIVVHKGVSPNGDGIEDFLQIDNITQYSDNRLVIMNRNGQLVYEVKGYDNSTKVFDGHSNKTGQMQLPGTYFFSLDYTVNGVIKHKTGFLVLKY